MESIFLLELMVILILSLLVLFVCNYLKIPLIIGYIVSGILVGPFFLGFVGSTQIIELVAEIGVIFLLFTIGIQYSLKSLFEAKKLVVLGGALQMVITTLCVMALALLFGTPANVAVFLGLLVSLSSTAIVMKVLQERGELESLHGKTTLSIMIFQDLMLIPLMFITPLLAAPENYQGPSIIFLLLTGFLIIGLVIISTRFIVPRLLYHSAKMRSQEIFLLSVIVICFAIAWIISQTGISLALGAFIAGLMISESEFSVAALSHIMPFRDVFAGFFFISIGMLLDVAFFLSDPLLILALAISVVLLKCFTGTLTAIFLNLSRKTAILTGLALSQIGEFSFILAKAGESAGLISGSIYQTILDVTLFTMVATPFLMAGSHRIAGRISDRMSDVMGPSCGFDLTRAPVTENHLIIVGYGLNGKNVARAAKFAGIPYRIIDINPDMVRTECDQGEPIFYGDGTQAAVLELAGIRTARIIVVAIADRISTQQVVQSARSLNTQVHILVRTRFVSEVEPLHNLGANEVIPEEFETSIEIFTRVLRDYLVPTSEVNQLVEEIRGENYEMLRSFAPARLSQIPAQIPGLDVASLRVTGMNPVIGKSLTELPWRHEKGISVIAIRRGDQMLLNPGGDTAIEEGDVAIVVGNTENVRKFIRESGM